MRIEISGSVGQANRWRGECEEAGFELELQQPRPETRSTLPAEIRATHPDGTVIRIFPDRTGMDRAYVYPPGGTDRPTAEPTLPAFVGQSNGSDSGVPEVRVTPSEGLRSDPDAPLEVEE